MVTDCSVYEVQTAMGRRRAICLGLLALGLLALVSHLSGDRPGELLEFFDGIGPLPVRVDNAYHRMDDSAGLMKEVGLEMATEKKIGDWEDNESSEADKRADSDLAKYSDPISAGIDAYTRVSRAIDSHSDEYFHHDGTRKDARTTAEREHDELMKAVGIAGQTTVTSDPFGVPPEYDDGVPTGRDEAVRVKQHRKARTYSLRDGLSLGSSGGEGQPSFVAQAQQFLADPKGTLRVLEERQAATDRAVGAASSPPPPSTSKGAPVFSLASQPSHRSPAVAAKPPPPPAAAGVLLPGDFPSAASFKPAPEAASQTASASEVEGLPMAEAEEAMQVMKQPDGTLLVVEAPRKPEAHMKVATAVAVSAGEAAGMGRGRVRARGRGEPQRRRAREVRRMSEEFEEKRREARERREREQQRLDDQVTREREQLEIAKLRKQVKHMRERERIRKLRLSIAGLRHQLAVVPRPARREEKKSSEGKVYYANGAVKMSQLTRPGDQGMVKDERRREAKEGESQAEEDPAEDAIEDSGEGEEKEEEPEKADKKVAEKPVQRTVIVCDGVGCNKVVMPEASEPAKRPGDLSRARTRKEIRSALEGGDESGTGWLLPWDSAFEPEVHLNDKGEIRADHDDPHGVLAPHQKFQNAVYRPSGKHPGGDDHARKGSEERKGITNRVGKHLFQDNIVEAETGFNAGLGRHTRAQQAADWERNWEGVRTRNRLGQKIRVG